MSQVVVVLFPVMTQVVEFEAVHEVPLEPSQETTGL
jgi:hypothetical protein